MKKFFKIFAVAVCMTLFVGAFAACGDSGFDGSKAIVVVARESTSGTRSAFMELIGLKDKEDPGGVVVKTGTPEVMAAVKGNPQAIAYESLGYCTADVKILKVDGIDATVANIDNDTYKISRPLSVVYKTGTLDNAGAQAFLDYLISAEAQAIIAAEGYVTVNKNAEAYVKPTLSDISDRIISVGGSTSLRPLMEVLAKAFEGLFGNVTVTVGGGGSGTGRASAVAGSVMFGMISDEFGSKAEDAQLEHSVVAKDGIAVIVNKENPLENITMAQLKKIYDKADTSRYSNWNAIDAAA